jgi:hypothetical protein
VSLLPRELLAVPVYQTELAIVPVRAGTYAVRIGTIDGFERCELTLTTAA